MRRVRDRQAEEREVILRLAHRARKDPDARDVLHDALLALPEYERAVKEAHALAFSLWTQHYPGTAYVFLLPRRLIEGRKEPAKDMRTWMAFRVEPFWNLYSFGRHMVPVSNPPATITSRNVFLNISGWQRQGVLTYVARA